jgi:thymidine phosphorylase
LISVGTKVNKDYIIGRVHAASQMQLDAAVLALNDAYSIAENASEMRPNIIERL